MVYSSSTASTFCRLPYGLLQSKSRSLVSAAGFSAIPWHGTAWGFPVPFPPAVMARLFSNEEKARQMVRRSGRFSQAATAGGEAGTGGGMLESNGDTRTSTGLSMTVDSLEDFVKCTNFPSDRYI